MRMIKMLAIAVASLAAIAPARGDVLTYTESFVASGSLGAQGFTDSAFTLTVFGDTSTIFTVPGVPALATTVDPAIRSDASVTGILSPTDAVLELTSPANASSTGVP